MRCIGRYALLYVHCGGLPLLVPRRHAPSAGALFHARAFHDRLQKIAITARHRVPNCTPSPPTPARALPTPRRPRGANQQVQVLEKMIFFACVHRRIQADFVRIFAKGSDVAHHHGLTHSERAQQRAGAFAHRRIAQIQHDVAGGHVSVEILDGNEVDVPHMRGEIQGTRSSRPAEAPDAPRPPGSCERRESLESNSGKPAAIPRCACTVSEIRRCRSTACARPGPGARGSHAVCFARSRRHAESYPPDPGIRVREPPLRPRRYVR